MKFIFTLLCTVSLSTNLFCQLVNAEFDNGVTIDTMGEPYEDLVGWDTNNTTVQIFRATTPNVKFQEGMDVGVHMSTTFQGLDGLSSGIISQDIDAQNLVDITYLSKCDSIADRGACVVNIYNEFDALIYTDSVLVVEPNFIDKTIDVTQLAVGGSQRITLEFKAFGQLGNFEPFQAYSEFLLLNAKANYISSTDQLSSDNSFIVYPNPCSDRLFVDGPIGDYKIFDAKGQRVRIGSSDSDIETSELEQGIYFTESII